MGRTTKRIAPAVLQPLKEALTLAFWYKSDLRAFLTSAMGERELIAHLDWTTYKRAIVAQLVHTLASQQHKYFDQLLDLILATSDITDPAHLKKVEDGDRKYAQAVDALNTLRLQVTPYRKLRSDKEEAARRREAERAKTEIAQAMTQKLGELKALFYEIVKQPPQERGYSLERLLNELFALYDIDAKSPFRVRGEQIDGAFSFEGGEFLLEAKWRKDLTPTADLDAFTGKVNRKLDNTLGLLLSMTGFQPSAIELHSQGRPVIILMDGADLSAVMEGRLTLPELLTRKRQHAARTGEIHLKAYTILT